MQNTKENVEPLYQISVTCPNCSYGYKTSKVRRSFVKTIKTDSDFCVHYKDINPDFYLVRICPMCGYAFTENFKSNVKPHVKERIYETITKKWQNINYGNERNINDAIKLYKLSLLCAQLTEESNAVIGGICFKLACLYRFQDDDEQERRFLQYTLDSYMNFFENESNVNVNEGKMIYLIGEIHRRLGDYHTAVKWFNRVINEKSITDIGIIKKAREQWQLTKEQLHESESESKSDIENI